MPKVKHSAEDIADAISSYECFQDLKMAARGVRASNAKMRGWLVEAGVVVRGRGNPDLKVVEVDREELFRLAGSGLRLCEVARGLGVSRGVVRRRLEAWGYFDEDEPVVEDSVDYVEMVGDGVGMVEVREEDAEWLAEYGSE